MYLISSKRITKLALVIDKKNPKVILLALSLTITYCDLIDRRHKKRKTYLFCVNCDINT